MEIELSENEKKRKQKILEEQMSLFLQAVIKDVNTNDDQMSCFLVEGFVSKDISTADINL